MSKRKTGVAVFLRRKSVLAVNLTIVSLVAWGFVGEFSRNRAIQVEIDRLEGQARTLEARNLELAGMADSFSASSMLEREARLKLNMKKPGEEVVVIRESSGASREAESVKAASGEARVGAGEEPKAISNAKKWFIRFFPMTKNQ